MAGNLKSKTRHPTQTSSCAGLARASIKKATLAKRWIAGSGPAMTTEWLSALRSVALDERRERLELLLEQAARGLVLELAGLLVEARGAAADEDFRLVQRERVEEAQHLAQVVLNARPADRAGRRRLDGDRLADERLLFQTRHPVERILQSARQREIVFRRVEDDAVGGADGVGQRIHGGREAGRVLDVGIVEGKLGERRRFLDGHAGGRQPGQEIHDHPVERAFAQAAADADDVELSGHGQSFAVRGLKPGCYCCGMPALSRTSVQRLISATMWSRRSSGVELFGSAPAVRICCATLSRASAWRVASTSFLTIGAGEPAGSASPYQLVTS